MLLSDVYISAHELFVLQTIGHMCRIDIVSKNLLANVFAIVAKEIIEKKLCKKITHKCRKNRKNNKCNKIRDLEREKVKN